MSNWFVQKDEIQPADISKFLKESHKVQLMKLQDASTIKALANPGQFITDRQTEIDRLYADDSVMVTTYEKAFNHYTKTLKLPASEAHELARDSTESIHNNNVKALELAFPGGYEKAMRVGRTEHNMTLATANNADTELVKQDGKGNDYYEAKYRATKKKYKSQKKAIKSKST